MADHDVDDEQPKRSFKESLFDSITKDQEWLKEKNELVNGLILTKHKMLKMMEEHPIIEEWFKLYKEIKGDS